MAQFSREFMDLVRAIGDCKSKQEEDTIVGREVVNLRVRMGETNAQVRLSCSVRAVCSSKQAENARADTSCRICRRACASSSSA